MGQTGTGKKIKLIVSDCHLSAGRFFEERLNPHEDFFFDDEMCDLIHHFSSGQYGSGPDGPVDVELFINGDFLDFLNVPYQGEFEETVTEEISLYKLQAIFDAHPKVMDGIRRFASLPGKRVTYMIGNHDADLFFPKVREAIIRRWDPDGQYPSQKVDVINDRDRVRWEGGVEVHHGNQFEAIHLLNFDKPLLDSYLDRPVLNLPWGSFYVLKILNRFRWEREHVDKVRPIKIFLLLGLLFDPWFTIRFAVLSSFYFLKTRFVYSRKRRSRLSVTMNIIRQETKNMLLDLEAEARDVLDRNRELKTVIFGHTHYPMNKIYPDGRQYINTGTWTKMINLNWRSLGQQYQLTFALVTIQDGKADCALHHWIGEHSPYKLFSG